MALTEHGSPAWPGQVFVGRGRELGFLNDALRQVSQGRGRLALVAGEAGVGKTTLVRRFSEEAEAGGALLVWGACVEGEWRPPFAPWVEALTMLADAVDLAQLERHLGPDREVAAHLVPAIRQLLPDVPPPPRLSPQEERLRLFEAVARTLLRAGRDRPLLVVLDDVHWADTDTLNLLAHLARSVHRARLLVVAVFRPPDAEDPLAEALALLEREPTTGRVTLGGLSAEEVGGIASALTTGELPDELVGAVHAETGGNAFYVREVLRQLWEETSDQPWQALDLPELGVPEGVRRLIARRLGALQAPTRMLLVAASVFSGGFGPPVLEAMTDLEETQLLDSLDEAVRARFIRVTGSASNSAYDFSHAIVRHALQHQVNPQRRARLHRRAAEALERVHAGRERERAAEIAHQYHASISLPGAERGVAHSLRAAEHARAAAAYDEAQRLLSMAAELAASADAVTAADVLCRLALAQAECLLLEDASVTAERAQTASLTAGVPRGEVATFLARVAGLLKDAGARPLLWEPLVKRGLALVGDRRDLVWARLTLLTSRLEPVVAGPVFLSRPREPDPEAVRIAREEGDAEDHARTLDAFAYRSPEELHGMLASARGWDQAAVVLHAFQVACFGLHWWHGRIQEVLVLLHEMLAIAERVGSIPAQTEAALRLAMCWAELGHLPEALASQQRAEDLVARLGPAHRLQVLVHHGLPSYLTFALREGDPAAVAERLSRFVAQPATGRTPLGATYTGTAIMNHALAGNREEARELLEVLTPALERLGPRGWLSTIAVWSAARGVWETREVDFAPRYRDLVRRQIAAGLLGPMGVLEDALACMSALAGSVVEAEQHFREARLRADAQGLRTPRAIIDCDEALALIRAGSGDRTRIRLLLEAAETAFADMGNKGWVGRVHELRAGLGQARSPDGLTRREVEVLGLLARGRTNQEIATQLFISVPTAQRHIANIYTKIGARNRSEATAYALRHGMVGEPGDDVRR